MQYWKTTALIINVLDVLTFKAIIKSIPYVYCHSNISFHHLWLLCSNRCQKFCPWQSEIFEFHATIITQEIVCANGFVEVLKYKVGGMRNQIQEGFTTLTYQHMISQNNTG